mmetsp:Transcript_36989/g.82230  ORF Transcript_36989/g.82230 Transcript_36989/m.82230 type:complete len:321 (-) Transcript_36989:956-1918(-)
MVLLGGMPVVLLRVPGPLSRACCVILWPALLLLLVLLLLVLLVGVLSAMLGQQGGVRACGPRAGCPAPAVRVHILGVLILLPAMCTMSVIVAAGVPPRVRVLITMTPVRALGVMTAVRPCLHVAMVPGVMMLILPVVVVLVVVMVGRAWGLLVMPVWRVMFLLRIEGVVVAMVVLGMVGILLEVLTRVPVELVGIMPVVGLMGGSGVVVLPVLAVEGVMVRLEPVVCPVMIQGVHVVLLFIVAPVLVVAPVVVLVVAAMPMVDVMVVVGDRSRGGVHLMMASIVGVMVGVSGRGREVISWEVSGVRMCKAHVVVPGRRCV